MITVACVDSGNYLGRGREYVEKLRLIVARHLSVPHVFVCLTDYGPVGDEHGDWPTFFIGISGERKGWWAKTELFKPGIFPAGERVLYLDLDTVVVGSLDELVKHKGILHLDRWGWEKKVYGSGVMIWDSGEHAEIWTKFTPDVPKRHEGDQNWLTELGGWPALPDGICVSYRYHCKKGPPAGASVICMHGRPKQTDLPPEHWVYEHWRI